MQAGALLFSALFLALFAVGEEARARVKLVSLKSILNIRGEIIVVMRVQLAANQL